MSNNNDPRVSAIFHAYRRGWTTGAGVRAIADVPDDKDQLEAYNRGWSDGRDALSSALVHERERLGLAPSGTVSACSCATRSGHTQCSVPNK